jgi:hypothetical protein
MRNPGARDNSGGLENAIHVRGIIPEAIFASRKAGKQFRRQTWRQGRSENKF